MCSHRSEVALLDTEHAVKVEALQALLLEVRIYVSSYHYTCVLVLLNMSPHTTIYASSYYYLISTSNTTQLSPEHGAGAPQDRQESPEHVVEAAAGTDFTCLTGTKVRLLTQLLQMWGWEVVEERRKTRAVGQRLGVRLWRPRR